PLSLLFNITAQIGAPSTVFLRRLHYALAIDPQPITPPSTPPCLPTGVVPCPPQMNIPPPLPPFPGSFFQDTLHLCGHTSPSAIRVEPGVLVPRGNKLQVCVDLSYSRGPLDELKSIPTKTVEFPVVSPSGGGQYLAYRQAYIRAHLLDSGRGLA